tara:strand:+ start:13460 stop:13786 length:327 start_codon:yes stop_codon:yes gene_type:complete
MLILLVLFSKTIFNVLYPSEFKEGINILYIMSTGLFFIALYDCFGTNGLIHKNKEKLLMKNTIVATFLSFILSWVLIYYFQALGAATSILIGRIIMGTGVFYFYKKIT